VKLVYSPEAKKEIKDFSPEVRDRVRSKFKEIKANPTGHEDVKLIQVKGSQIYRLKIKDSRGSEIDHRAVFDISKDKIRIYSVFKRDKGYQKEELEDKIRDAEDN